MSVDFTEFTLDDLNQWFDNSYVKMANGEVLWISSFLTHNKYSNEDGDQRAIDTRAIDLVRPVPHWVVKENSAAFVKYRPDRQYSRGYNDRTLMSQFTLGADMDGLYHYVKEFLYYEPMQKRRWTAEEFSERKKKPKFGYLSPNIFMTPFGELYYDCMLCWDSGWINRRFVDEILEVLPFIEG